MDSTNLENSITEVLFEVLYKQEYGPYYSIQIRILDEWYKFRFSGKPELYKILPHLRDNLPIFIRSRL